MADNPLDVQVGGDHYKKMAIQPFEFIHGNNIPFAEGNVIRYVSRWRSKGGISDLQKAKHYLEMLIDAEQKELDRQALQQVSSGNTLGVTFQHVPSPWLAGR